EEHDEDGDRDEPPDDGARPAGPAPRQGGCAATVLPRPPGGRGRLAAHSAAALGRRSDEQVASLDWELRASAALPCSLITTTWYADLGHLLDPSPASGLRLGTVASDGARPLVHPSWLRRAGDGPAGVPVRHQGTVDRRPR